LIKLMYFSGVIAEVGLIDKVNVFLGRNC